MRATREIPPLVRGGVALTVLAVVLLAGLQPGTAQARPDELPAATVTRLRWSGTVASASWTSCPAEYEVDRETTCSSTEVIASPETRSEWFVLVIESTLRLHPGEPARPVSISYLSGVGPGASDARVTAAQVAAPLMGQRCVATDEWDDDWGWLWDCEDAESSVQAAWHSTGEAQRELSTITPPSDDPGAPFLAQLRGTARPAAAEALVDGHPVRGRLARAELSTRSEHLLQVCRGGDWPGRDACRSSG